MAAKIFYSHFTPTIFLYFLLLSSTNLPISAINITNLLSAYPDLSDFTNLLTTTAVAADLTQRSSLTLLVIPNSFLRSSTDLPHQTTNLADVLRCHIILQYLSFNDLQLIPPSGKLFTTLFQTTGRASTNSGYVNITHNPLTNSITILSSTSNATVLSLVKTVPYNISIFTINALLVPYNLDLMASETRPPLGLNITKALIDGHNFNVAASMLTASGVEQEFEQDEGGAGITLFVPTDDAFSDLPTSLRFQSLPADKKAVVLRFHVLHSYYPLGSLESIVNPVQPTLATETMGAGSFTLNISKINGSVAIDTGVVQASVTRTVFDQNPVAIFGVSKVLLPREMFGKNAIEVNKPSAGGGAGIALPPDNALSPEIYAPPSHLTSPPGLSDDMRSEAVKSGVLRPFLGSLWIGLLCWGALRKIEAA